jgi:hypothetical protein
MNETKYLIEGMARDMVLLLMERRGMGMKQALHTLYNSATYAKLTDTRTGLYFQSPRYVYDFLEQELQALHENQA